MTYAVCRPDENPKALFMRSGVTCLSIQRDLPPSTAVVFECHSPHQAAQRFISLTDGEELAIGDHKVLRIVRDMGWD